MNVNAERRIATNFIYEGVLFIFKDHKETGHLILEVYNSIETPTQEAFTHEVILTPRDARHLIWFLIRKFIFKRNRKVKFND